MKQKCDSMEAQLCDSIYVVVRIVVNVCCRHRFLVFVSLFDCFFFVYP